MTELIHQKLSKKKMAMRTVRFILAGAVVLSLLAGLFWGSLLYEDIQRDYNEMGKYYDPVAQHAFHDVGPAYFAMTVFFVALSLACFSAYLFIDNILRMNRHVFKRSAIIASSIEGFFFILGMLAVVALEEPNAGMMIFWVLHFPGSFMIHMAAFLLSVDILDSILAFLSACLQFVLFTMIVYWLWLLSARLSTRLRG